VGLVDEVKGRRTKAAQAAMPAMMIRPTVQDHIARVVEEMVRTKQIKPEQAEDLAKALLERADPEVKKHESEAFRRESGSMAEAPATLGSAARTAGFMTAFPWLISRGSYLWGKKPKDPMTLGQSFRFGFLPSFLPVSAALEGLNYALAPLSDPQRARGERSYLKSLGESFRGAQEGLAERGAEARARYGMLGIPLQMFHGVMNPLASLAYLGRSIGGAFSKPRVEEWAQEAARKRQAMLNP